MPHAPIRITEHDRKLFDDHRIVLIRPEFVDLLRACRGSRVLLYQSVRKAGRAHVQVGYFASADIEDILHAADGSRYAVFLKEVQAMNRQFDDDFSRFGQSIEVDGGTLRPTRVRSVKINT